MSAPVLPDEQTDVPSVALVPDRAEAPISEITERFFRALLLKVPLDRIEELHLFSPLRSGGVETGIAVIAAREIVVPPQVADMELPLGDGAVVAASDDATVHATAATEAAATDDAIESNVQDSADEVAIDADLGAEVETHIDGDATAEMAGAVGDEALIHADAVIEIETTPAEPDGVVVAVQSEELAVAAENIGTDSAPAERADTVIEMGVYAALDEPSPYADEAPVIDTVEAVTSDESDVAVAAADTAATADGDSVAPEAVVEPIVAEPPTPVAPIIRHTVYTARYRLVQKGPERGKWEADVVAEAEAPLITVETVVRGVQRRAGEESDTTRFTAAQIARALRIELPTTP